MKTILFIHGFSAKKEERTQHVRVLSSSLYKDTTICREIQIALTFRNTPRNVKLQRFAADGDWHVLYYEGLIENAMYRTLQGVSKVFCSHS